MTSYLVRWEIQVDADDPEDAVEQAIQMFPVLSRLNGTESWATQFQVWSEDESDDPIETTAPIIVDLDGDTARARD